ncbi:hypothetical protein L596_000676 [Steinernema carpocapsae]|uniref:Protein kinase domain-containing protein n=1 Tax=Steinernema carpocapsae TaxID=34508 RepID=A0A4U8UIX1_STECR|nr:hypothetical protein L596_000676 [Steinernema carpocapsae]
MNQLGVLREPAKGEGIDGLRSHLMSLAEPSEWRVDESTLTTKEPQEICKERVRAALLDELPSDVAYKLKISICEWELVGDVLQIIVDIKVDKPRIAHLEERLEDRKIATIGRVVNKHLQNLFQQQLFLQIRTLLLLPIRFPSWCRHLSVSLFCLPELHLAGLLSIAGGIVLNISTQSARKRSSSSKRFKCSRTASKFRYRFRSPTSASMPAASSATFTRRPSRRPAAWGRFDELDAKLYSFQIYAALDYIHSRDVRVQVFGFRVSGSGTRNLGICHRDLKPSNLIVDDARGLLKLADFGSAKILKPGEANPAYQVTRYYRALELIFGSTAYTLTIDLWAAACIVAELFTGKVLLCGRNSENQARLVIDLLGYPTEEQIKAMGIRRPRFLRKTGRGLKNNFENEDLPSEAFDLVSNSLNYDPHLRLSATKALSHPLFDVLGKKPTAIRSCKSFLPHLDFNLVEQVTQMD